MGSLQSTHLLHIFDSFSQFMLVSKSAGTKTLE